MFRSYLSAALGNLSRNWLYAGVTILGLAISFAAAILIGLYVRDEYSFERFIPDYQRVYRLKADMQFPGQKVQSMDITTSTAAANFRLDFPEAEQVARLTGSDSVLKRGDSSATETVAWADPGFFKVMRLPVLAGDADAALEAPDGLVLTREMARKYFGQDEPLGRTIQLNTAMDSLSGLPPDEMALVTTFHPMRVMAVLKDIPSDTHLSARIFAAGRSPYSPTSLDDRHPSPFNLGQLTYVKLKPGVSTAGFGPRLRAFGERRYPGVGNTPSAFRYGLAPLKDLHFSATSAYGELVRPAGDRNVDAGVAAVGGLIVVIAAINFVTLMTARATRRAIEVGVRKAVGASRRDLIVQFMGEALIYVLIAMLLATALAELTLPYLNAFLRRTLALDYLGDPALAGGIVGGALLTAILAGVYPALVLSAFRPSSALKGGSTQPSASAGVRQILVVAQFAILIGLIVMTATIYRQTRFALNDALRLDTSQVIRAKTPCRSAFAQEVAALPGVKAKSCASYSAVSDGMSKTVVVMSDRSLRTVNGSALDVGFLEMQGLTPLAGRFFARDQGQDMVLDRPDAGPDVQPSLVLNESGARLIGFARPADAVGKMINWARWSAAQSPTETPPVHASQVVGVVRDFTLGSIRTAIEPSIYYVEPNRSQYVLIKLDGRSMPETLSAIRRVWTRTGHDRPLAFQFEEQAVQDLYRDVIAQGVVIAICAGLAIFIACIGLFALAAFTTERRTKEIGVRKAMGASTLDVVRLLLWQFTQPVLWANLIAWPAAWWAMNTWLHGFAYRVDLPPWLFLTATAAAVIIAWATVSIHAFLVARARPVLALRYE